MTEENQTEDREKEIHTLRAASLFKSFGKKQVVRGVDFSMKTGEVVGLLGPNGAGKTTTIKMITGILNPDEGDILIDGKSIQKEPLEAKKNFGFVPDSPDMFLKLKGIEYLNFIADIYEIDNKKYAWSIVKLYYSVFYLLRCEILLSNHIIIRCKTLYYTKIKIGEKPIAFNSNKFKGDHQLTIALEEKLYNSGELSDPILGNKIDDENVYMWFMKHRDRVNYQMKDFSDPYCDPILAHIISYFNRKELIKLFEFYNSNNDYLICFDVDHTILAVPYKKLISVYKRIKTEMIITSDIRDKIIETNKLLFNMGVSKRDIANLVL